MWYLQKQNKPQVPPFHPGAITEKCTFSVPAAIVSMDSSSSGVVSDQSSEVTPGVETEEERGRSLSSNRKSSSDTTTESPASVHWGATQVHMYERDDSCIDTEEDTESISWAIEPDRANYHPRTNFHSLAVSPVSTPPAAVFDRRQEDVTPPLHRLDYFPAVQLPPMKASSLSSTCSSSCSENSLIFTPSCSVRTPQGMLGSTRSSVCSGTSSSCCSDSGGRRTAEKYYRSRSIRPSSRHCLVRSAAQYPQPLQQESVAENNSPFSSLPKHILGRIFEYLSPVDLCRCATVCKRWYSVAWDPTLWTNIRLDRCPRFVDMDWAVRTVTKILSYATYPVCLTVERIVLNAPTKFTDKGLNTIAHRCPELRYLDVRNCPNITNMAMLQLVSKCVNLEVLIASGCTQISCLSLTPEAERQVPSPTGQRIFLRYLDLSHCPRLDDAGVCMLAGHCSELTHIYLRSCPLVGDQGISYLARYCPLIREISLNGSSNKITDAGIKELTERLGENLRYLSLAKCSQISDRGVCHIAKHCPRLRYLNLRGCPSISDTSLEAMAAQVSDGSSRASSALHSLDVGGCDVSDDGVLALARRCSQLVRVSFRGCDAVTDRGLIELARRNRYLQLINIQDCALSQAGYRQLLRVCPSCVIEHSNPAIF